MLRGRMRSIDSRAPDSTLTSSAGQRNQSNSIRPNDELRPSHVEQAPTGEILARRDDLVWGLGVGKVFRLVDQNDPAGHERPFRMTMAALSRSRPKWVTRSNAGHGTA